MTPASLEMIKRLINFETVSRNSNLDLIHYVQDYLHTHGIPSTLVPNHDGNKANLYATIGPQTKGGVILSGHTDVVPVDGQPWSTDPFTVTRKDNRLYGRGTCDMKSFIAIALAMVPTFQQKALKRPIHLAFSYDEEVGCLGAPALIAEMVSQLPPVEAVIVGEPTSMQPVVAHKGIAALKTTVTGHEAHSSQVQRGVSAVMVAAKLVSFIQQMMDENRQNAEASCAFIPPYTTLHVGTIHGGTAINIISRKCEFVWDIRCLPGDDWQHYLTRFNNYAETLLREMRQVSHDANITTEVFASAPPLQDKGGSAQALLTELLGTQDSTVVPFAAEAGQFQEAGYSVVLCGPGSIDQAHQPDEYIDISQVTACEAMFTRLSDRLAQ